MNNTVLESTTGESITQVTIQEPALNIKKGVVATNNPAGVFAPGTVGPVAFNASGTMGARFTGPNTGGLNDQTPPSQPPPESPTTEPRLPRSRFSGADQLIDGHSLPCRPTRSCGSAGAFSRR